MSDKQRFSEVVTCGHCSNRAPMLVVAEYSNSVNRHEPQHDVEWTESDNYEMLKCPACAAITLRSYFWHTGYMDAGDGITYTILYPLEKSAPRGLSETIAKDYEAAQRVKNISPNAFAVLLGRVLELVCEDRHATGNSLHQKLLDLSAKGEIPAKLVDVAKSLKDLRNVGAHAALGNLTAGEVPILEDLTRAILEYVYSAPALAEAAVQRLQVLKKRSARKQDGA